MYSFLPIIGAVTIPNTINGETIANDALTTAGPLLLASIGLVAAIAAIGLIFKAVRRIRRAG